MGAPCTIQEKEEGIVSKRAGRLCVIVLEDQPPDTGPVSHMPSHVEAGPACVEL